MKLFLRPINITVLILILRRQTEAFLAKLPVSLSVIESQFCQAARGNKVVYGWFDNFWRSEDYSSSSSRQSEYPEQYPATYEPNTITPDEDKDDENKKLIRPLLKNTQLESRPITMAYQASRDGWSSQAFHMTVDGKGASVVLITTTKGDDGGSNPIFVGGYNPKGWASLGGARPSVAAFLFYSKTSSTITDVNWQKLRKVGGGGLACARDDPNYGISFGPDSLVISLLDDDGMNRIGQSKLGPYFERGPEDLPSLFSGGISELNDIRVYVGLYEAGEEIPYSGGVLDMTSG